MFVFYSIYTVCPSGNKQVYDKQQITQDMTHIQNTQLRKQYKQDSLQH